MALADMLAAVPAGSAEEDLLRRIDFARLPSHVAIIMDGNGRWAADAPSAAGRRATAPASSRSATRSKRRRGSGIPVLTLYAFSVENWKRPDTEVSALMGLLQALPAPRAEHAARATTSASTSSASATGSAAEVRDELEAADARTATNTGMVFNIALSYGGRAEIVDAAQARDPRWHCRRRARRRRRSRRCCIRPASPIPIC